MATIPKHYFQSVLATLVSYGFSLHSSSVWIELHHWLSYIYVAPVQVELPQWLCSICSSSTDKTTPLFVLYIWYPSLKWPVSVLYSYGPIYIKFFITAYIYNISLSFSFNMVALVRLFPLFHQLKLSVSAVSIVKSVNSNSYLPIAVLMFAEAIVLLLKL